VFLYLALFLPRLLSSAPAVADSCREHETALVETRKGARVGHRRIGQAERAGPRHFAQGIRTGRRGLGQELRVRRRRAGQGALDSRRRLGQGAGDGLWRLEHYPVPADHQAKEHRRCRAALVIGSRRTFCGSSPRSTTLTAGPRKERDPALTDPRKEQGRAPSDSGKPAPADSRARAGRR
jgi:hypothetical protein